MKLTKAVPLPTPVIRNDFDRVFERFFGPGLFNAAPRHTEMQWAPTLDFSENDKEYIVRVEIPGMAKEDLEINLDGQVLTLSGHRELEQQDQGEEFFWKERESGKFLRTIRLPAPVDEAKVVAAYRDGIMTVRMPKARPSARTRIPIA